MSVLTFFNFTLLNLSTFGNAAIFALALSHFKIESRPKLLISASIIFFSQITILLLLLGSINLLNTSAISISTYSLFALSSFCFRKKLNLKLLKEIFQPIESQIDSFTLLAIFGPIMLLLTLRLFNAILQIPLEYDNIAYHLPFVVEWIQTGSILKPYYSAFASPISYYPSNYELLDLWVMLPFKNDYFINLLNFPIFALFGLTTYQVCRNFKATAKIAALSSAFLFYMPIFLRQAGIPLVDLYFSFTFIACIYFLQEFAKDRQNTLNHVLFGLTLGLFVGTKYLGIVYGVFPLIIFLFLALTGKNKLKSIGFGALATISTGAFWYLRNWIEAGNPLFPVDIKIGKTQIFQGYQGMAEKLTSTSLLTNVNSPETWKEFKENFFNMTGWQSQLIAIFLTFSLLFIAFQIIKFLKNKKRKSLQEIIPATLLLLGTLIYFYLYWRAPYSYRDLTPNIRYGMMALILGTLNTAFIISKLTNSPTYKTLQNIFTLISFSIFAYALMFLVAAPAESVLFNDKFALDLSFLESHTRLFALLILTLLALFYGTTLFFHQKRNQSHVILAIALLLFATTSSWRIIDFTKTEREKFAEYFYTNWYTEDPKILNLTHAAFWLNEHAPLANIAYTGFNYHYHLFGRDLQRQVTYININDCQNCRYSDFKDSPDSIRRNPNYENWLQNLQAKNINYIVIEPEITPGVPNHEFTWATTNPEKFQQVWNQENSYIFQLLD